MKIYTVVEVESGVAVSARSFVDFDKAKTYSQRIGYGRNWEKDDIQLFEQNIRPKSPTRKTICKRSRE